MLHICIFAVAYKTCFRVWLCLPIVFFDCIPVSGILRRLAVCLLLNEFTFTLKKKKRSPFQMSHFIGRHWCAKF